jgi:hypothetical protein
MTMVSAGVLSTPGAQVAGSEAFPCPAGAAFCAFALDANDMAKASKKRTKALFMGRLRCHIFLRDHFERRARMWLE